jgi:hypothetical protein
MPQFRQELAGVNGNHRGVLALRRFEGRGNVDVTEIPGIQKTAASNRRARALNSLEGLLEPFAVPGRQGRSFEDVHRLRTSSQRRGGVKSCVTISHRNQRNSSADSVFRCRETGVLATFVNGHLFSASRSSTRSPASLAIVANVALSYCLIRLPEVCATSTTSSSKGKTPLVATGASLCVAGEYL